jgi:hypothetical protein
MWILSAPRLPPKKELLNKAFADEFDKQIKDVIQREPCLEWRKILEGTQFTMSKDEKQESTSAFYS